MVTMTLRALGNLQCEAVHEPSGVVLRTDAPKDVGGDASSFSPTDLVAAGLLSCIMTTMGLVAAKSGLDLSGMQGTVRKTMSDTRPRRVARFDITLDVPLDGASDQRARLEQAAHHCPVHHSLHPDIVTEIVFSWL